MISLFGLLAVSLLIQPRRLLAITAPGTQLAYWRLSPGSGLFLLRGSSFPRLCSTFVLLKFIKLLSFCSSILSGPPWCQPCLPATKCSPHVGVLLMRKHWCPRNSFANFTEVSMLLKEAAKRTCGLTNLTWWKSPDQAESQVNNLYDEKKVNKNWRVKQSVICYWHGKATVLVHQGTASHHSFNWQGFLRNKTWQKFYCIRQK